MKRAIIFFLLFFCILFPLSSQTENITNSRIIDSDHIANLGGGYGILILSPHGDLVMNVTNASLPVAQNEKGQNEQGLFEYNLVLRPNDNHIVKLEVGRKGNVYKTEIVTKLTPNWMQAYLVEEVENPIRVEENQRSNDVILDASLAEVEFTSSVPDIHVTVSPLLNASVETWISEMDPNITMVSVKFPLTVLNRAREALETKNKEYDSLYEKLAKGDISELEMNRMDDLENEIAHDEQELGALTTIDVYAEQSNRVGVSVDGMTARQKKCYVVFPLMFSAKAVTINIRTQPEDCSVSLPDLDISAKTPATINEVPVGRHKLRIEMGGRTVLSDSIEVSMEKTLFEYDVRPRRVINFTSDPPGASLWIDGVEKGRTPVRVDLPYGSYQVSAVQGSEEDVKSITVSDDSDDKIMLEPIRKKSFEARARYEGQKVPADLYIDGKKYGGGRLSYKLNLPVGKKYEMKMLYSGDSRTRKIRVKDKMDEIQEFNISYKDTYADLSPVGFTVGFVSKTLHIKGEGESFNDDGVFEAGEGSEWLSGLQLGLRIQPVMRCGVGIYTGLYYELYYKEDSSYDNDMFYDHCFYMPLHVFYRIPLMYNTAMYINGGLGFNYSFSASYQSSEDENAPRESYNYGEDGNYGRFNMLLEAGLGFRFGSLQLNFQYGYGLTDHESYSDFGDYTTKQNKLSIGLSLIFGKVRE